MAGYLRVARAALESLHAAAIQAIESVATPGTAPIGTEPGMLEMWRALTAIRGAGFRIMRLDGRYVIGIWADLDGPEVRRALQLLGVEDMPVRYLDGDGIPMRYKVRRVKGEPVSPSVLLKMEASLEPRKVRDCVHQEDAS